MSLVFSFVNPFSSEEGPSSPPWFDLYLLLLFDFLPGVLSDPGPHDQEDGGDDQAELDHEGVEVGGALGHDVAHQIDSSARKIVKLLGAGEWVCR